MSDEQNPWAAGVLIFSFFILLPLGILTILGTLIAVAVGVDLNRGPEISAQAAAIFLLSVAAIAGFVTFMAIRWDNKHREVK